MAKHRKLKLRNTPFTRKEQPVIDEKVRQERVLPLIAALNAGAGEQASALNYALLLVEDRNIRHMLLRERLIKTILSILSETSLNTAAQCFAILRSVVRLEGRDPAVFLIRENIKGIVNHFANKGSNDDTLLENMFGLIAGIIMSAFDVSGWESALQLALAVGTNKQSSSPGTYMTAFEMLYYISEDIDGEEITPFFDKETVQTLKSKATASPTWITKLYGIGIEFNAVLVSDSDMLKVCEEICEFLKNVPRDDVKSVQTCLELLTIAAQSNELEQVLSIVNSVGPILVDLLPGQKYQLRAVSVLNNIGWSLDALSYQWVEDAETVFNVVITNCFGDLTDTELVSSSLGLLGSTLVQSPGLAQTQQFHDLVYKLLNRVEVLYNESNLEWISIARSLVVVLANSQSGRIQETTKLIFLMLENGDAEAQIDALNSLFDIHGDNEAEYNQNEYVNLGLNDRLQSLKPLLKRTLKSVPKSDEIQREQALDALSNLDSFIAYKRI